MHVKVEKEWAGRNLVLETGKLAKQADGAVIAQYGETMVLATVVHSKRPIDRDYLPLYVEYRQKFYAAGKIPGGFFKREGRPQTKEILSARQIDRPIRPLIPSHFRNEIQVFVNVLSADGENDPDILGVIASSAALAMSPVPFAGPIAAVRIGMVNEEYIVNPTFEQLEESVLELVVSGTDEAIVMVEGGAREVSESVMQGALELAHSEIRKVLQAVAELIVDVSAEKLDATKPVLSEGLGERVESAYGARIRETVGIAGKDERSGAMDAIKEEMSEALAEDYPDDGGAIRGIFKDIEKAEMRRRIVEEGVRSDGRGTEDVRPIWSETSVLPRVHGSAVFTRGQTQALAAITLGSTRDEQKIDALEGETWKSYMLHYNFPSFSVGEVRPIRGPGRREIGHGALAERAIEPLIPVDEVFPYTIRIVSDILESNGSSSMATVCAGSLALMDAGVPIKSAVAGVAMGLIKEGEKFVVLTDILGVEDHLGDMDFKVAGTLAGITAFQMDSKIGAVPTEVLTEAMSKARIAREHILGEMAKELDAPRSDMSKHAPRIVMVTVPQDKIGEIIGPGGRVIRRMQEETETKIDINDEGIIKVSGDSQDGVDAARTMIENMIREPEVGEIYDGVVRSITAFGAFIEFLPGRDGLCHISELEHGRVEKVEDVLKMGEEVKVKVIGVEDNGKVRLSRRALIERPEGMPEEDRSERRGGGGRGGRDSRGRGGDRGRPRKPLS
ncbi:polyribonucleotide nucleotidyltransferase [bacterium]|nr:polyribonucleotide nucleotidyltransferase [bacterium]